MSLDWIPLEASLISASVLGNDVFDCDVTVDEDQLFKSIQAYPGVQGVRIGSPMWKQ